MRVLTSERITSNSYKTWDPYLNNQKRSKFTRSIAIDVKKRSLKPYKAEKTFVRSEVKKRLRIVMGNIEFIYVRYGPASISNNPLENRVYSDQG